MKYVFSFVAVIILLPTFYFLPFGGDFQLKLGILLTAMLLVLAGNLIDPFTWMTGLEMFVLVLCLSYFNVKWYLKRKKTHAVDDAISEDTFPLENMVATRSVVIDGRSETMGFHALQAATSDGGQLEQYVHNAPEFEIEELMLPDDIQENNIFPSEQSSTDIGQSEHINPLDDIFVSLPEKLSQDELATESEVDQEETTDQTADFLLDEENWQRSRSQWNLDEEKEQDQGVSNEGAIEQREWLLDELIHQEGANDLDLQEIPEVKFAEQEFVGQEFGYPEQTNTVGNLNEVEIKIPTEVTVELILTDADSFEEQDKAAPDFEERQRMETRERFFNIVSEQLNWMKTHVSVENYERAIMDYLTSELPDREYYMLSSMLRDLYLETAQFTKLKSLLQEQENRFYYVEYIKLEIDYHWKRSSNKDL